VRTQRKERRPEGKCGGHADEGPEETTVHVLSIAPNVCIFGHTVNKEKMKRPKRFSRICSEPSGQAGPMADIYSILGFIVLTVLSLGLIKVLEKV
jgi:hypothetical protein